MATHARLESCVSAWGRLFGWVFLRLIVLSVLLLTATLVGAPGACGIESEGLRYTVVLEHEQYVVAERNGQRLHVNVNSDIVRVKGVPRYRVLERNPTFYVLLGLPAPSTNPVLDIPRARYGSTIVVGPGRFRGNIRVPSGVTVLGSGPKRSWLQGSIRFGSDDVFDGLRMGRRGVSAIRNAGYVVNTTFRGCQFRGGGGTRFRGCDVVSIENRARDLTFISCRIECNLGTENAQHTRHFDNVFMTPDIVEPSMDNILFKRCRFGVSNGVRKGSPRFNVEIYADTTKTDRSHGFRHIDFEDCLFYGADDVNLDYSGSTLSADPTQPNNGPCHVTGCTFYGNGKSYVWFGDVIVEAGAGYVEIARNTFHRGAGQAIAVGGNGAGAVETSCSIHDNLVDSTNAAVNTGIKHEAWEYVSIMSSLNSVVGNTVMNTSRNRCCVIVHGGRNTVTGNRLVNKPAGRYTVALEDRSHENVVTDNLLIGGGIWNEGRGNTTLPNR